MQCIQSINFGVSSRTNIKTLKAIKLRTDAFAVSKNYLDSIFKSFNVSFRFMMVDETTANAAFPASLLLTDLIFLSASDIFFLRKCKHKKIAHALLGLLTPSQLRVVKERHADLEFC